jgi:hypothetical protein
MGRLKEFLIDPASNQFSTSRLCLLILNMVGAGIAIYMTLRGGNPTTMVAAIVASDASVYALNSAVGSYFNSTTAYTNMLPGAQQVGQEIPKVIHKVE